jgi:hypothetical protein
LVPKKIDERSFVSEI